MLDLADRVDEWVPTEFKVETDHKLNFNIGFNFVDIDNAVITLKAQEDQQLRNMQNRLEEMKGYLGNK